MSSDTNPQYSELLLSLSTAFSFICSAMLFYGIWSARIGARARHGGDLTRPLVALSIVHHAALALLFEIFVVWSPVVGGGKLVEPGSPTPILVWVTSLCACVATLIIAAIFNRRYRMTMYITQIVHFVCMVVFLCDRVVTGVLSVEGMVIFGIIICGIVEVFTVPDFFDKQVFDRRQENFEFHSSRQNGTQLYSIYDGRGNSDFSSFCDETTASHLASDSPRQIGLDKKRRIEAVYAEATRCIMDIDVEKDAKVIGKLVLHCQQLLSSVVQKSPPSSSMTSVSLDSAVSTGSLPSRRRRRTSYDRSGELGGQF